MSTKASACWDWLSRNRFGVLLNVNVPKHEGAVASYIEKVENEFDALFESP